MANPVIRNNVEQVTICDLCGSNQQKLIDQKGNVIQCKRCGLKFVNLRPTQKDIAANYNWSYAHCPGWGKTKPEAQLMHERRFNFLENFIQRGKLLDVGAGRGEFLSWAKKTGRWQCFGTETCKYAVNFAKKEFNLELSLGQLEDLDYPEKCFDAITFWHVLEHLPYPSKAIVQARQILKDTGFLFIAVPNDSWLGRRHFFKNAFKQAINWLPVKKKLKLKKMYPEMNEEGNKHLFYFTPDTLTRLLKKHKFRIKRRSIDYDYDHLDPQIERKYRFELLFCRLSGINLANAILIAAQKS